MRQKFPVNNFECIEDISQISEDFTQNYNEEIDKGYFQVDAQYIAKLHVLLNNLLFLPERIKMQNSKNL